ncbi:MAG TPA: DUF47 family protein [Trichormus sp.]|jgi:hypothetical protein
MSRNAYTPTWLKFFPHKTDFFELLGEQSRTTLEGVRSLHGWIAAGAQGNCPGVHEMEHAADKQKMNIEEKLRDTLVTPFEREDIYDISAQLDRIMNSTKRLVKDMELMQNIGTDASLVKMSEALVEGTELLMMSIAHLHDNLKDSGAAADKARKTQTKVEQICREGLSSNFQEPNSEQRALFKHLYDCMCAIAERVERLAEKLLHISLKLG